jgi:hypothetical protein
MCLYHGFVRDIYLVGAGFAGEGGLESGASLSGLFAGKPAPTKMCICRGFVRDIYLVGAGLPAKAALSLVPLYRASSLASQLLQK